MRRRIEEDDSSVPAPHGPWQYCERFRTGGQYPVFCRRRRGAPGPEELLFDGDAEADGKPFFRVAAVEHSPDHQRLAVSVDEQGSESYAIRVRDLASGDYLPDLLPDASGDIAWAAGSASLFYTRLDANHRSKWVYRHRLGDDPAADALVYEEPDAGFFVSLQRSESERFILIEAHDHETSEVRLLDAEQPEAPAVLIAQRAPGTLYEVGEQAGRLFILTNAGEAEDFQIVEASVDDPGPEAWRELAPHRPGAVRRVLAPLHEALNSGARRGRQAIGHPAEHRAAVAPPAVDAPYPRDGRCPRLSARRQAGWRGAARCRSGSR